MVLSGIYIVFIVSIFCGCFKDVFGTMDCSLILELGETDITCHYHAYDSFTGVSSTRYFYCGNGYKCCTGETGYASLSNGCCYGGGDDFLYSKGELAGLVLNLTAIATVIILALVILGATYCNDREDESHLFTTKKK